jgi:hypothetical protein
MMDAMSRNSARILTLAAVAAVAGTTGCHIDTHKENGNENVKIATPFGGMSVKTNDAVVQGGVGLSMYPGATLIRKDKDNGAADVNMSFGSFHLGVKALSYHTDDPSDKVTEFYRKDMSHFGAVLLCHDHRAVGTPTRTQDGLACEDDNSHHPQIHIDEDSKNELKAGSKQHQHIVSIEPQGTGTKIGLIALDLPGNFGKDDDDAKQ